MGAAPHLESTRAGAALTPGWHVARWGPLGWLETCLKAGAFVVAFAAVAATTWDAHELPSGWVRWTVAATLAAATLGLALAIVDRIIEREIVAMVFVVMNVGAHVAMLAVATTVPVATGWLTAFGVLMLAGEVVKLVFLTTTGFRVREIARSTLIVLTTLYAALYLVMVIAAHLP